MKGIRCFSVQIYRAICSRRFLFACLGIGIVMYGSSFSNLELGMDFWSVWMFAGGMGSFVIALAVFPLFPFSMSYVEEYNGKNLPMWSMRTGIKSYMRAKFAAAILSGMLAYTAGMSLYLGLVLIHQPAFTGRVQGAYGVFVELDKPVIYIFLTIFHRSLSAAAFCALSICVSVYIPNRFAAIIMPLVCYFLSLRMLTFLPPNLRLSAWIEGVVDAGTPFLSLLLKLGFMILITTAAGSLAIEKAERRMRDE